MGKLSFTSIRQRIFVYFTAIILVFTIAIIIISSILSRSIVNGLMERNANTIVQTQHQIIEYWKQNNIDRLKLLANSSLIKSMDWEQIEPFLRKEIAEYEDYYLFYFIATPDGDYNTTLQRNAENILEQEYFVKALEGNTIISDSHISSSTGKKMLVMTTPVWNPEHSEITGLLGLSIQLDKVYTNLNKLNLGDLNSNIYIVDEEGYFMAHTLSSSFPKEQIQELYPSWNMQSTQGTGSFEYERDGTNYRTFFSNDSDLSEWAILIEIPTSFFNQPVKSLIVSLFLTGTLCFLLVLVAGSWFASLVTKPFEELTKVFKQGAEGILTVRAKVTSRDEIGETSRFFNQMMDTIGKMTYYDPLTGLLNRPYFLDRLTTCLNQESSVILALVSIKGLSEIKTLLGPELTDTILINLAENLQTLNRSNVVVSRIAEADFGVAIVCDDTNVLLMIEQIEKLIKTPLGIEQHNLSVRLISGISISENKNMDASVFFRQAQTALYEAERSTRDSVKLYSHHTHEAIMNRIRFQTEIQTALNRKQFIVYYQPIVNLDERKIIGKEALIRWKHPVRNLLLPSDFLQTAEEGGFIEEIGSYMLRHVCIQHKDWLDKGLDLGWAAVNISPKQFRTPNFSTIVQDILIETKIPPDKLRIEITEDAMLSPTPAVLKNFRNLREMGVQLSIDDFGTAYATLDYLVNYPMETLKIDRSFINYVVEDERTQGLVRSIIGMGENLSMTTIAEGVERSEQLTVLKQMGCLGAQGFLFSKPIFWKEYPNVHEQLHKQLQSNYFLDLTQTTAT